MVKLYDITTWSEQSWWSTGGTRNKKIYQNPGDGELYYFKESFKKGERDYKHEFWSEILASQIGHFLGFNILMYDIAIRGEVVGCISKSMINQTSEELVEGGKYMQAFDTNFKPEITNQRFEYSFDLIFRTLRFFNKEEYLKDLVETIVFDALIGNSDRHQENWAIINEHGIISEGLSIINKDFLSNDMNDSPKWLRKLVRYLTTDKGELRPEVQTTRLKLTKRTKFSPIYDSGCSFGREFNDERIEEIISNEQEIEKYILKGKSEIHWLGNKISHFELVSNLIIQFETSKYVKESLKRVLERWDDNKIGEIVNSIDNELALIKKSNLFPEKRKVFVLKLLTLRLSKLREIYSQHK